jgi:hypothetical protein
MDSTFKTPKGTELPLLDLRGKPYLQVAHRLVWFREEHANWSVETEAIALTQTEATMKATVKDETGRIIAQGTKQETKAGFPDFLEKAETGAIGRALALCGYGTQFAPELDEGERLADAPIKPGKPATKYPLRTFSATNAQLATITKLVMAKHDVEKDQVLAVINKQYLPEHPIASSAELSHTVANTLIKMLEAPRPDTTPSGHLVKEDVDVEDVE